MLFITGHYRSDQNIQLSLIEAPCYGKVGGAEAWPDDLAIPAVDARPGQSGDSRHERHRD
jgi:hypothetical protein